MGNLSHEAFFRRVGEVTGVRRRQVVLPAKAALAAARVVPWPVRPEEVAAGRTRMSIESVFPSVEAMDQVLAMGAEEGLRQAIGQIDAILAADAPRPA